MAVISSIVVVALCRGSNSILVEEGADDESAPIWIAPGSTYGLRRQ